jgi:hypothetical protein
MVMSWTSRAHPGDNQKMGHALNFCVAVRDKNGFVADGVLGFVVAAAVASCSNAGNVRGPGDTVIEGGPFHPDAGLTDDATMLPSMTDGSTCGDGGKICGTQCVDTQNDPKNCGDCSLVCGMGAACARGRCQCPGVQTVCGNQCVDTTADPSNCGFCGHNCQGNGCTAGLCQASLIGQADMSQKINDIAIDATNVYWTWTTLASSPTSGPGGGVSLKPFAGGNRLTGTFVRGGDPRGIAVDTHYMYWVDFYFGSVSFSPLMSGFNQGYFFLPSVPDGGTPPQGPIDVAIDAQSQNIYWVDFVGGTVSTVPMQNGVASSVRVLAGGLSSPIAIALDMNYVYWVDFGTTQGTGSVNRVRIGSASAVEPLASGQDQPRDIAVDGTSVYWTSRTNSGSVSKVPIGGGPVTILAKNQGGPSGIVVDAQFVYWTNYNDDNVVKVPLGGLPASTGDGGAPDGGTSSPYILASKQNLPVAIAIDEKNVYWANQGDGTVMKVAK